LILQDEVAKLKQILEEKEKAEQRLAEEAKRASLEKKNPINNKSNFFAEENRELSDEEETSQKNQRNKSKNHDNGAAFLMDVITKLKNMDQNQRDRFYRTSSRDSLSSRETNISSVDVTDSENSGETSPHYEEASENFDEAATLEKLSPWKKLQR
jgi:hypothetical protein